MVLQRLLVRCRELSLQNICGQRSSKLWFQVENVNIKTYPHTNSEWKSIVKRWFMKDSQVKSVLIRLNETLNVIAVLFGKQCNALAVQRLRRTAQIVDLYSQLYDKQQLGQFVKRLSSQLARNKKDRTVFALFSAALFSWEQNGISDEEVRSLENEIQRSRASSTQTQSAQVKQVPQAADGWQKVIDREKITVWQKPVPGSAVYEYKVYGTFNDIPARAFFDIQVDLNYRKQWDHLLVNVDVVDADKKSGCEVVKWIQQFPYPMYSREYVFVRRIIVDTDNQQLVLLSRGVEHPRCPETKNYVRVKSYKSNLILKPHKSIDENGFDYMLTYCDDPQASIPSVAYSWMASSGVPDYCNKMHNVAKKFHQQNKQSEDAEEAQTSRYDQISEALGSKKQTMTA